MQASVLLPPVVKRKLLTKSVSFKNVGWCVRGRGASEGADQDRGEREEQEEEDEEEEEEEKEEERTTTTRRTREEEGDGGEKEASDRL